MIMVDQAAHSSIDPRISETLLCMPLSSAGACTWSWNMGAGWRRETSAPGRLLVVPANLTSRWEITAPRRLLLLVIPAQTMQDALGPALASEPSDAFRPLADATWEDQFLQAVMLRLWEAAAGIHPADPQLVDSLIASALTHLLLVAGSRREVLPMTASTQAPPGVALPRWRLRRVTDYADAHLHETVDLDSLARAAGLSRRHFARVFLRQMGETPHRWLMTLRLERAKELLANSDFSIIQIAETCGFAGQAHLTRLLSRRAGMTPLRWRNEHKGHCGNPGSDAAPRPIVPSRPPPRLRCVSPIR
jgi:AraC family transcriptional regulator